MQPQQQIVRPTQRTRRNTIVLVMRIVLFVGFILALIITGVLAVKTGTVSTSTIMSSSFAILLGVIAVIQIYPILFPPSSGSTTSTGNASSSPMSNQNPNVNTVQPIFQFNLPLQDPNDYYGRIAARNTLITRVSNRGSSSIVGERRMGKTWLLTYLQLVAPTHSTLGSAYRIGYVSASHPDSKSVARFVLRALNELKVPPHSIDHTQLPLSQLSRGVQDLKQQGLRIGVTWAYAPLMELRRRAAEMLSWLPPEDASWSIANGLLTTLLCDDPDPLVRDAVKQVQPERKQRVWANEYLTQVRSNYRKSNNQRLATWRYAHALTVLGDDMTIVELQADLDTKELALYEMQWVLWILNNTREQWKKTVDKWPKPWFAWDGEIMYERGVLSLSEHSVINGIVCLYKDSTDNAIQPPQWRGTFWSDKPISLPEQSITALTSIRNRQSEVRLINQMSGVMWLIEEFRDQGL